MKTLIADDDDVTRLLLGSALTNLGHDVREATNGREAWKAWEGGEFPFVIWDWMMPDLDGLEFCRHIRAEQRADYTYVILLTSRLGKTSYLEAMTAGADYFSAGAGKARTHERPGRERPGDPDKRSPFAPAYRWHPGGVEIPAERPELSSLEPMERVAPVSESA